MTERRLAAVGYSGYTRLITDPLVHGLFRPQTSRLRSGPDFRNRGTTSSPTWATNRRTSRAASPNGPTCCPIRSTGSRERQPAPALPDHRRLRHDGMVTAGTTGRQRERHGRDDEGAALLR